MLQQNASFEDLNVYAVSSADKFRTLSIDLKFFKQSAKNT